MSGIDVGALGSEIGGKIFEILSQHGKKVASYAEQEGRKLAQSAKEIAELRLAGKIDDKGLKLQLQIQKNATESVLLAIKGMSKIAVEQAINAAMDIVRGAVSRATGFPI
jgi:hypothetical protein